MFRPFILAITALSVFSSVSQAADRVAIVFDGSGSMWGQIEGRTKIEIARDAMSGVLGNLPGDLELGLFAYGHREKGNCSDIELIVPPGAGTAAAIRQATDGITPKGKTPLSAAVRKAAETLRFTEDKATVVLVTGRGYGGRWETSWMARVLARNGIAAVMWDGRGKGRSGTYPSGPAPAVVAVAAPTSPPSG